MTDQPLVPLYDLDALKSRLITPSLPAIRLDGKMFVMPDGSTHPGPLEGIVIDFVYSNVFYATRFTPGVITAPDCAAMGNNPVGLIPHTPDPQADGCDNCPNNQWVVDPKTRKAQAKKCKNTMLLAVVAPDDSETVLRLSLAPVSSGKFQKLLGKLVSKGVHYRQAVVSFAFDPTASVPVLIPSFVRPANLDAGIVSAALHYIEDSGMLKPFIAE